jgi:alcohol dehydrogenase
MRALYFHNQLEYAPDYPDPQPLSGEALIRVLLAGVCNTDLEIVKGYMNFQGVLGHEFVGVVERAEDLAWIGRRVVGEINAGCRKCDYCRSGLARHCPDRSVLGILNRGGAFADYLSLPIDNLHPVPPGVSNEEAVFTEPIAAACEILAQSEFAPGEAIVVLGDGKLGLLIAQVLHAQGLQVTLIGKHLERAAGMLDPGIRLIPAGESLDRRFAFVVEATGNPEAFVQALNLLKPRGCLFLKSTTAGRPSFPLLV